MKKNAKALIVLGMHRSGTSAMMRVCNLLGVKLGSSMLESNEYNEMGYWEHKGIIEQHDIILKSLDSMRWDSLRDIPENWLQKNDVISAKKRIKSILDKEFGTSAFWGFKDPRICRLIPLWAVIFKNIGVQPHYIHIIRNPYEVALSLRRRDNLSEGDALLLWLRYVLEAEYYTRGIRRITVTYDNLIDDWEALVKKVGKTLKIDWPLSVESIEQDVAEYLSEKLRHHIYDPNIYRKSNSNNSVALTVYKELQRKDDAERAKRLDSIRNVLFESLGLFSGLERSLFLERAMKVQAEESEEQQSAMQAQSDEYEGQFKAWKTRATESEKQLSAMQARSDEYEGQLDTWKTRATESEKQLSAMQARSDEYEGQLDTWKTRATESEKQLSAMQTQSDEYEGQFKAWKTRATESEKRLSAMQARSDEYEGQLDTWKTRATESEKQLSAMQTQSDEYEGQFKAWKTRATESEKRLSAMQARSDEYEGQLDTWKTRATESEKQLSAMQARSDEYEGQFKAWKTRATESEKQLSAMQARSNEYEGQLEAWKTRAVEYESQLSDWKDKAIEKEEMMIKLTSVINELRTQPLVRLLAYLRLIKDPDKSSIREAGIVSKSWRYFKINGLSAFVRRVLKEIKKSPKVKKQFPTSNNPELINYHIDLPEADDLVSTTDVITVAGWACSQFGLSAIDIFINEVFISEISPNLERPDVGELFPDIKRSNKSGFHTVVDLQDYEDGGHILSVAICDKNGNTAVYNQRLEKVKDSLFYHDYFLSSHLRSKEVEQIKNQIQNAANFKLLFIYIFINGDTSHEETINSLLDQDDTNWSCDIIADKKFHTTISQLLSRKPEYKNKIRIKDTLQLKELDGDDTYLCFIQEGETLAKNALLQWESYLLNENIELCYSDNDLLGPDGVHISPNFKPTWSPNYLLSANYIGGVYFVKNNRYLQKLLGGILDLTSKAWRYDLLLHLTEKMTRIGSIKKVLWSQLTKLESNQNKIIKAELKCVQEAISRRGEIAEVSNIPGKNIRRICRSLNYEPKVSIIIPTMGSKELLVPLLESMKKTEYSNYELIFIDNGRGKYSEGIDYLKQGGIEVLERHEPFNWAKLNNDGAKESAGELLLFLNDDMEVIKGSWLRELVSQAVRDEVGSVGAMLTYPDGRIQHGGIFLVDHGGGARHFLHFLHPEKPIYQDLQYIAREVSGNTGACLMIRRNVFEEMGGFDEDLAIVGNDIDMCLRMHRAGYCNIWTPECVLIHHESISRKSIKITADEGKMWDRWGAVFLQGDPYYNPNLSQTKTDCSLNEIPAKIDRNNDEVQKGASAGLGINLIAYIRAEMGVGEASRSMALAMDSADIPFCIINYERGNPSRMQDHSWDHKIVSEPRYDINLFHINADLLPEAINSLPKKFTKDKYNIGLWAWELPEFPEKWTKSFDYLDEIWVPSEFVRQAVLKKSPVPVFTVPHSVRSMNQPYLKRPYFNLPEGQFLFLSMYDVHSIQERKNPKGAIEAYKLAFPNASSHMALVVKVNNANENELLEIQRFIGNRADIIIVNKTLSRYEVDSLLSCCDCFVSLHRSEGFGLVIAESMALGKPVIATHWSSNVDFMSPDNSACVMYQTSELEKNYGPYDAGQHWADPDIDDAASWMYRLVTEPELYKSFSDKARSDIKAGYSAQVIGQKIADRIKTFNK